MKGLFFNRCIIEEEYATKLAKLAKAPIGGDEIGEFRNSLDTLRSETEKQAQNHLELANQIRNDVEGPTAQFHQKQINHRRNVQAPLERKFKEKQVQESYVKKSREKYEGDCVRIASYTKQTSYMQGTDLVKVQQKLQRTMQTMQGNERDFTKFSKELLDILATWEREWKDFCDSCQDLEEERLDFMKDIVWAYANSISVICVADDQSCEGIRTALDQLDPEKDVENFVNEYGTGNSISQPAEFVPSTNIHGEPQMPPAPVSRIINYQRITRRPPIDGYTEATVAPNGQEPIGETESQYRQGINGDSSHHDTRQPEAISAAYNTSRSQVSPPQTTPPSHAPPPVPDPVAPQPVPSVSTAPIAGSSRAASPANPTRSNAAANHRVSQPLPMTPTGGARGPGRAQTPPPPLPQPSSRILFYVKSLYDYQATIQEEFDFQAGDIIAVTATPDDGWWSGELLDEARRVEGRNVFPSNFVCLF